MIQKLLVKSTLILLFSIVLSCNNSDEKRESTAVHVETESAATSNAALKEFVINNNSFMGISPNDVIADHADKFQFGKIRDGEIVKKVLVIEIDGQELGYAVPNNEDKRLIGNITFQSPKVKTEKGIKVGDSFGDLVKKHPNLTLKKSRNGKKLYAKAGRIVFLLDFNKEGTEIQIEEIPENTSIIELKLISNKASK